MSDDDFLKEFGFKVKMYRIKKGLTQAKLGEITNISEHRISDIENGKCNLTLKTVNKFSVMLGIPAYKLFTFED